MEMKKIISAVTAAVMAASVMPTVCAEDFAVSRALPGGSYSIKIAEPCEGIILPVEELPPVEYVPDMRVNSYFGNNTYSFYSILDANQKEVYDIIRSTLANDKGASKCIVPLPEEYKKESDFEARYQSEVLSTAFAAFVMDFPEYTGLSSCGWACSSMGGYIVGDITVNLYYCDGQEAGSKAINYCTEVNNKVATVVSGASAYSSKYEKLMYFAKYLCDNVTYNHTAAYTGVGDNCWNAYGALINGDGVCESYAEAFKLLCDAASIPCAIVVSSTHEWNIVNMDGTWYYVDVTWMDTENYGYYDYSWFLTGTDYASDKDHITTPSAVVVGSKLKYPAVSSSAYVYDPAAEEKADQLIADFVERLYVNMLGRASDPSGKANWINHLKNGRTAAQVSERFVFSAELTGKNLNNKDFVTVMYNTFLDRAPDAGGLEHWTTILSNGCTRKYIFKRFVESPEFRGICESYGITAGTYTCDEYKDQSAGLTAFVSRLYTKALNRPYDADGLEHWTKSYITKAYTLDEIARRIVFSEEFQNRKLSDEAFVDCMYATFFNRQPDAGGKAHWLNMLKNGGTREDVFKGFLRAQEYKNLVASFGL